MLKEGDKAFLAVTIGKKPDKSIKGTPIVFDTADSGEAYARVDSSIVEPFGCVSEQIDYISAIRFLATIGNGSDKLALKGDDLMTALTWDQDRFMDVFDPEELKDRICGCMLVDDDNAYVVVGTADDRIIRIVMDRCHHLMLLCDAEYNIQNLYDMFCGPRSRYIGKRSCNLSDMLVALQDTVNKIPRAHV